MKKLIFALLFVPFMLNGQPLVDLSAYHDGNRLWEMTDNNFTSTLASITSNASEIEDVPQYTGDIYYVSASGDDTNDGKSSDGSFATIGKAISELSVGDKVIIGAKTYTETGLDLDVNGAELWFEIGSVLDPASGDGLVISGNFCRVLVPGGALKITPAALDTGVVVTGNFCYLSEIRVDCGNSANVGFDVTGDGCDLRRCRASGPLIAAFIIQGDKVKLEDCCTGGEVANTSIGFWLTGSCDKFRLKNCGTQGHSTAGYQVDAGCTNGVVEDCYSGGGDGKWTDAESNTIFSKFSYDETLYKEITLDGSTSYNLFEVIGAVEIVSIFGHVTTALEGANTDVSFQLYSTNGTDEITKAVDADLGTAAVGTIAIKTEDPGKAVTILVSGTPSVDKTADPKKRGVFLNADNAADTYIRWVVVAGDTGGVIHFHVEWKPLTDNGFLKVV